MAKRLPVQVVAQMPAPRVIHYADPAAQELATCRTPAQLAVKQREYRDMYARWAARQAVIAERERKARRFWLGFGAVIGVAVLAVLALVIVLVWHAFAAAGLGLLAVPAGIAVVAGLVVGGHRCITIVQHWH